MGVICCKLMVYLDVVSEAYLRLLVCLFRVGMTFIQGWFQDLRYLWFYLWSVFKCVSLRLV